MLNIEIVKLGHILSSMVSGVECAAACLWIIGYNDGGHLLWMKAAGTKVLWYWCDGGLKGKKGGDPM